MSEAPIDSQKRQLIKLGAAALAITQTPSALAAISFNSSSATIKAATTADLTKIIPSSQQPLPVIGMGTWQTFNVGNNQKLREKRCAVLKAFFEQGGGMIDSSPMYGSSEAVIGDCLQQLSFPEANFSATKVWTSSANEGIQQIADSHKLWRINQFDLFQVHNLAGWKKHLPYLQAMKANGRLNYVGITTSHGRRHTELEQIMRNETIDFVQLTYNIADREVESRLLPLAKDRGIAVIVNRPFQGGSLFRKIANKPLPPWAKEINCDNWAQFFLKFVVSHDAVTCAIPATTRVEHMLQNMAARLGPMPDSNIRQQMFRYWKNL